MVVRTPAVNDISQRIDDGFLRTYYGCTPQDWEELSSPDRFVEFIDGKLIMHSPASLGHQDVFGFLHVLLRMFVEERDLGAVLTGPFTMELALERKFEPDIMFLSHATRQRLMNDRLIGPPDWVIEIASPSTRGYDRGEKRECYRVGGVREYWMVDPLGQQITVDRPAGRPVHEAAAGVVTSEACPGFWVRAEWFWQEPLPNVAECLRMILAR